MKLISHILCCWLEGDQLFSYLIINVIVSRLWCWHSPGVLGTPCIPVDLVEENQSFLDQAKTYPVCIHWSSFPFFIILPLSLNLSTSSFLLHIFLHFYWPNSYLSLLLLPHYLLLLPSLFPPPFFSFPPQARRQGELEGVCSNPPFGLQNDFKHRLTVHFKCPTV